MIPEEDHDNFSDDEVSIDVPSGTQSQLRNMNANGSMESLQISKGGSVNASSTTLDTHGEDGESEGMTGEDDDDDEDEDDDDELSDSGGDFSESSETGEESETYNKTKIETKVNAGYSTVKEGSKMKKTIGANSRRTSEEIQGEKEIITNKRQKSIQNDVKPDQNIDKQRETKANKTECVSDTESVDKDNPSSILNSDDNESDTNIDNVKSDVILPGDNNRNDSADSISRDSFSDDHWDEISIDEDDVQTIVQQNGDARTELTTEVSSEKQASLSVNNDNTDMALNPNAHINDDAEVTCNDESSDEKNLRSFKTTDKSEDVINKPNCTPAILVTEDDHDIPTERLDTNVKYDNTNKETIRDNEEINRGVSVSNIVLDSHSVPLTPTVEYASISSKFNDDNDVNDIIESEMASVKQSSSPDEIVEETNITNRDDDETDDVSEFMVMNEHSDTRSLSPLSDFDYDYYNKRRGSQVKIKLEGRRRQRLSVSDCEPTQSPTDSRHSDDENNDVIPMAVPSSQGSLLDKREKMEKLSFKYIPEKQDQEPEVHEQSVNTVIDIHDRSAPTSRENSVMSSQRAVKSPSKQKYKNVKNINSLNAELIAIYNSSVPDQVHHPSQHMHRDINSLVERSRNNNEETSDTSYFSMSRDQARETKSFVIDINQQTVKTGGQFETVSGNPRQDFNTDTTFNKFNKHDEDDSGKNGETKSSLLPNDNETGNCQIKIHKKCAIEHETLSHKCERKQLSLLQNGHKNNEIITPPSSIEQPLASENKKYQIKCLKKRQTYGDLYKRECLSAPSVRVSLKQQNVETDVSRERNAKKHLSARTERELHLKASKLCLNDRSANVKFNPTLTSQHHEANGRRKNFEIIQTGSDNRREMSARARRPCDDQFELGGFADREMSARLRRTESSLTDTARLRSIRKLLKLTDDIDDDNVEDEDDETDEETRSIIHEIIEGVLHNVCNHRVRKFQTAMKAHRCVTNDDDGDEVLACLLQTSCSDVDPSKFTCDVINPVDVCPLTKKHEHLVSNIVRISSTTKRKFSAGTELMASIPIAHWYVEQWEELVIRQQDGNGHWENVSTETADVIKIDDVLKVYYGVNNVLTEPCTLAVVSRPRVTSVTMTSYNQVVNSVSDDRVKMHVFSASVEKQIKMQVVPVDQILMSEFCDKEENKKACVIISSSPLVQICIDGHDPESLAFDVPYVTVSKRRPEVKSPVSRSCSPYLRAPDNGTGQTLLSPYLSPTQSPRRVSLASPFVKDKNQRAFHLAQIDEDDEVRVKLLGNNDSKTIDVVTGQLEDNNDPDVQTLRFSVYDRVARLIALETKGSLEYSEVEKVTRSFVNFIVKQKVTVSISQDPRNVYSILFTAMVNHPHRQNNPNANQAYKYFTTSYRKEIQIYEGDVVAIAFRGNVDVPDKEQLIYSFHGYRGIKRHFDIQVSNPMSQRSLQTYHGALQVFTLKSPRYSGLDRKLAPCNKNGWELTAEFPLLLPKYLKSTPVIINKAPVSLRFHEPLTVDFIRTICSELVNEWTKFAKALGISNARVQAIKQQHRNQISDKVLMDVIINWMKTQRISQDKVSPLINALRICNRLKLASELAHRFSAQKANRSKTTREKSLQRAFAVICKSSSVIAKWRQLLHHLCQDGDNHVVDITKEIDEKYPDEITKCQNALLHWKSTTIAPSVWKLVDALRANRCNIVADTIVTTESKRK